MGLRVRVSWEHLPSPTPPYPPPSHLKALAVFCHPMNDAPFPLSNMNTYHYLQRSSCKTRISSSSLFNTFIPTFQIVRCCGEQASCSCGQMITRPRTGLIPSSWTLADATKINDMPQNATLNLIPSRGSQRRHRCTQSHRDRDLCQSLRFISHQEKKKKTISSRLSRRHVRSTLEGSTHHDAPYRRPARLLEASVWVHDRSLTVQT